MICADAVADVGAPATGTSMYDAPAFSEYWNLSMPTSSVADRLIVTAPRYQLFWPVGGVGDSVATPTAGGAPPVALDSLLASPAAPTG